MSFTTAELAAFKAVWLAAFGHLPRTEETPYWAEKGIKAALDYAEANGNPAAATAIHAAREALGLLAQIPTPTIPTIPTLPTNPIIDIPDYGDQVDKMTEAITKVAVLGVGAATLLGFGLLAIKIVDNNNNSRRPFYNGNTVSSH